MTEANKLAAISSDGGFPSLGLTLDETPRLG